MFKSVMIGALIATILTTGSILGRQNTGGDKGRRMKTATAPGLNPQPLPPGRHHHRRHHRGHRRHPNALTLKQK
jgi:hypothetical protein